MKYQLIICIFACFFMYIIMFNDLYDFVPDSWKFYISYESLLPIIKLLNRHGINEVIPRKEDIFECFRLIDPENVSVVIIGEITGDPASTTGIAYGVPRTYEKVNKTNEKLYHNFNDTDEYEKFDKTLYSFAKQGILLVNYPLTAIKNHRKAHCGYGWEIIIKNILYKLLYRESNFLICIAWNGFAYSVYRDVLGNMFPNRDNSYFVSPEYDNTFMLVGDNISSHSPIVTNINKLYEREYTLLAKQYIIHKPDYSKIVNNLLTKSGKNRIKWK